MRLSDFKGEEAIEVLADMIEPVAEILGDEEIRNSIDGNKVKLVSLILKRHSKDVIQLLAAMERESVEEYEKKINLFTLPMKLMEIVNDPDVVLLFQSQGQTRDAKFSGSASETVQE